MAENTIRPCPHPRCVLGEHPEHADYHRTARGRTFTVTSRSNQSDPAYEEDPEDTANGPTGSVRA